MFGKLSTISIIVIALGISGCGGGGGDEPARSTEVSVSSGGLLPRDTAASSGDRITWTNDSNTVVTICSGTLAKLTDSNEVHIAINKDGTFTLAEDEADFGTTYLWKNNETTKVTLEILDESNKVIKTIPIEKQTEASYSDFPRAGRYKFRLAGADTVTGKITLYGSPAPDEKFTSMQIPAGCKYSTMIFGSCNQSYYVMIGSNHTSHITGSIAVN